MGKMMNRTVSRVLSHALATVALIILVRAASLLHGEFLGGSRSRGVSLGISMELVIAIHLATNLTMALIPKALIQGAGIAVFIAATLYLLLPMHPVRALFMATAGAALTALAILVSTKGAGRSRSQPVN
jgi:hypothetical protein